MTENRCENNMVDDVSCGTCAFCNSFRSSDRTKTLDEKLKLEQEILMSNSDMDKLEGDMTDYE